MSDVRIKIDQLGSARASGAFGGSLHVEAPLVARAPANPSASRATTSRSWWARGLRLVRDAAIAVGVMALLPIALVTYKGDEVARSLYHRNVNAAARSLTMESMRPFGMPADPSITPMQAGLALNAVQPQVRRVRGFEAIQPAARPTPALRKMIISPFMFPTSRPTPSESPSSLALLDASVKGFSPNEMEYLRALATDPLWREFDLIARAPAVDIIGGQFKIPFGPDASADERPLPSFKAREVAHAAVSRAAYHTALGQRDSAEAVLRSIVSFGFTFIDNGSTIVEEILGQVIISIGHDALHRFYVLQHDPRAALPVLASPLRPPFDPIAATGAPVSVEVARGELLARIEDPAVPRGTRFESFRTLSTTSCTNVRELMFGRDADVRGVLERAPKTLARYPSERAVIELETRRLTPMPLDQLNPIQALAVSSATVAGVVLRNPRFATCTRMLTWGW